MSFMHHPSTSLYARECKQLVYNQLRGGLGNTLGGHHVSERSLSARVRSGTRYITLFFGGKVNHVTVTGQVRVGKGYGREFQ